MKRIGTLLLRATIAALLLLALGAGVASADPGPSGTPTTTSIPEDPGLE